MINGYTRQEKILPYFSTMVWVALFHTNISPFSEPVTKYFPVQENATTVTIYEQNNTIQVYFHK